MNLVEAIAKSCDVYFYGLADTIGVDRIAAFMSPFGFGRTTGLDISGELKGLLPTREWKASYFKRPADKMWFPGETVNFGIGQGYLNVTPLQMAHYVSVLASRGKVWKPRLVTGFRDALTGKLEPLAPVREPDVTLATPEEWSRIYAGMVGAVTHGTAALAVGKNAAYAIAGKTGRYSASVRTRSTTRKRSRSGCATTPGSSHSRLPTNPASRWRSSSRTVGGVPARQPRSHARCWTPTCSVTTAN
jgi:penicillin-binding protein 2